MSICMSFLPRWHVDIREHDTAANSNTPLAEVVSGMQREAERAAYLWKKSLGLSEALLMSTVCYGACMWIIFFTTR